MDKTRTRTQEDENKGMNNEKEQPEGALIPDLM